MKKKNIILTCYICAGALVLGGFIMKKEHESQWYKRQVVNSYSHAFTEFENALAEMDMSLQKVQYASSPEMICAICTEIHGKAAAAQMALGELPFTDGEYENTFGFISRVADYSFALARKAGVGETLDEEERGNVAKLSETATQLSANITGLLGSVNNGILTLSDLSYLSRGAAYSGEKVTEGLLEGSFKQMEEDFPEIPALIYDGPFSEHIGDMKPRLLEGKNEVTDRDASGIAAEFVGIPRTTAKLDGERAGNLPVYLFSANHDGGVVSFEISKQGGYMVDMHNSRQIMGESVSAEEAVDIAKKFLVAKSMRNMTESYYVKQGQTVTVNFAYTSNDIICYPDLVKITVALDNGSVVGFEAQGYIMNHTSRDIPAASVSQEDAQAALSPQLTVLSHQLAIIPTDGKHEKFCHEFVCENADGQKYIVYINAENGREEKILVLLESDSGTLTM